MPSVIVVEWIVFTGCSGLIFAYFMWKYRLSMETDRTERRRHGMINDAIRLREGWVMQVLSNKSEALLAVQTFRNVLMAATFLASVALVLASSLISMATDSGRSDKIHSITRKDPIVAALHKEGDVKVVDATIKIFVAALVTFMSFFAFTNSIRYHVHLGFFMHTLAFRENDSDARKERNMALANEYIRMGHQSFALGIRICYCFLPFCMWLLGPTALLVSSVLLVVVLFRMDSVGNTQQEFFEGHRCSSEAHTPL